MSYDLQYFKPQVIKNLFNQEDFNIVSNSFKDYKTFPIEEEFSRYSIDMVQRPILSELSKKILPVARNIFNNQTIIPTYTLFVHYENNASLYKHKDTNACTYTIDMCVYQTNPWDLWIEDKPYTLYPNEAVAYCGNDQMHWREEFPDPKNQKVAMIFFHFAEPDHWFFKEELYTI